MQQPFKQIHKWGYIPDLACYYLGHIRHVQDPVDPDFPSIKGVTSQCPVFVS